MGAGAAAGAPYGGGQGGGIQSLIAQALRGQSNGGGLVGAGGSGKSSGPPSSYQPQSPQGVGGAMGQAMGGGNPNGMYQPAPQPNMAPGYAAAQQTQAAMQPRPNPLGGGKSPGAPPSYGMGQGGPTRPMGQQANGFTQQSTLPGLGGYRAPAEQVQGPNNPVMQAKAGNALAAQMNQGAQGAWDQQHADDPWTDATSRQDSRHAAGQTYAYQGPQGYGNKGPAGVQNISPTNRVLQQVTKLPLPQLPGSPLIAQRDQTE